MASLGTYTFLTPSTGPAHELHTATCERRADIIETKEALAASVVEDNGTYARVWHLTGILCTNGGTTYLDKMSEIEGLQDAGSCTYTDSDRIHDASNQVTVMIERIKWGNPVNAAVPHIPFTLQLIEVP